MRAPRVLAISLSLLASLAVWSCRSGNPYELGSVEGGGATLEVVNQNFSDMDVYAVAGGLATRVGTVTGNSTSKFALHSSMISADGLRVVASPIGGNGRASSGNLSVSPGQTIRFTIGVSLRLSHAEVAP